MKSRLSPLVILCAAEWSAHWTSGWKRVRSNARKTPTPPLSASIRTMLSSVFTEQKLLFLAPSMRTVTVMSSNAQLYSSKAVYHTGKQIRGVSSHFVSTHHVLSEAITKWQAENGHIIERKFQVMEGSIGVTGVNCQFPAGHCLWGNTLVSNTVKSCMLQQLPATEPLTCCLPFRRLSVEKKPYAAQPLSAPT